MKRATLGEGMTARQRAQSKTVRAAAAASGKGEKGRTVGLTLRLDTDRWQRLRLLAIERNTKMHTLMLEGVDFVLAKGRKGGA